MENVIIPDRASNAGPDTTEPNYDWRDRLDFAAEFLRAAGRMEKDTRFAGAANMYRNHITAMDDAIEQIKLAKELLCR